MHRTQQNWSLVWLQDPYNNNNAARTNLHPLRGFWIDPRLEAVATRAPSASREDSCPQAILKLHPSNTFDHMISYEPQQLELKPCEIPQLSSCISLLKKGNQKSLLNCTFMDGSTDKVMKVYHSVLEYLMTIAKFWIQISYKKILHIHLFFLFG